MFIYQRDQLLNLADEVLRLARRGGASAAEADVYESLGQGVSVRLHETEHIEYQQDTALEVTVYVGHKKGSASTADFSAKSIAQTVQAALDIARYTAEDDCAGLADKALMAKNIGDLDLYHEWDLSTQAAQDLALRCEEAALSHDKRVDNSEGASVHSGHSHGVYANTHGFAAYDRATRHSMSCTAVARDARGMQRDYWFDAARSAADLAQPEEIGRIAAQRTLARLGAGSLNTGTYPVVFDRTVAGSLIGHLIGALSGGSLYRRSSFLCDSLGKKILADKVQLREEPHLPRTFAAAYYDDEGVATQPRTVVRNGVIEGYFLSSYSARKLGMKTTANAGGIHNLMMQPTVARQEDLLRHMGTGLLVTELMGQGVNVLTGDYSRGASGFWVENGVIVRPVDEITIASTLPQMFAAIVDIADDALRRSTHKIGSILIEEMTVAASG
ncbi:MAG: metalloprotease PmbA [Neisseria sp.]|nr:metalloprotease PmbA [Neisseria sp.]